MNNKKIWYIGGFIVILAFFTFGVARSQFNSQAAATNGAISGVVWQDFCKADCVAGSSLKAGNGLVSTAERRLAGIKVSLAKGKCSEKRPVSVLKTNGKGFYRFSNLAPGFYCVSVDSRQSNTAFPKPGYWSRPGTSKYNAIARYELKIGASTEAVNTSFGWNLRR